MSDEATRVRTAILAELDHGDWTHRGNVLNPVFFTTGASVQTVGKVLTAMTRSGEIEARGHWSPKSDTRQVRLAIK